MPKLEAELKQLNAIQDGSGTSERMLKEEVDEEDIAKIVSRWTGIPVSKMLEGEMQKLLRMEDRLHDRVVGQEEAVRNQIQQWCWWRHCSTAVDAFDNVPF